MTVASPSDSNGLCQSCGACCAYSANWPRFTIEDDDALNAIPADFVNARGAGMRCDGDRCTALTGAIGAATACAIYPLRPIVCRDCRPGDPECALARRKFALPPLPPEVAERFDQFADPEPTAWPASGSSSRSGS
jgi:Fe-S-cluster containining protein